MTRGWFVFNTTRLCGSLDGAHNIPAGEPVRILGCIVRCQAHTPVPVDWPEVDRQRHAIEAERLRRSASANGEPLTPPTRYSRPRPLLPFDQVADLPNHPRAAAAGDRE